MLICGEHLLQRRTESSGGAELDAKNEIWFPSDIYSVTDESQIYVYTHCIYHISFTTFVHGIVRGIYVGLTVQSWQVFMGPFKIPFRGFSTCHPENDNSLISFFCDLCKIRPFLFFVQARCGTDQDTFLLNGAWVPVTAPFITSEYRRSWQHGPAVWSHAGL